jgi:hypothetical protein
MKQAIRNLFAAAALAASFGAQAVDSVAVEAGGGSGVDVWRIGAQWKWSSKWLQSADWHLGGYWDLQVGQWDGGAGHITDLGITPVFRYQMNSGTGPYFEGAIGAHIISDKQITRTTRTSTSFQFGDHVGVGVRFGDKGRYDLGLRLQHHSNGSIKRPNPGTNFAIVRFQYHFD